MSDPASCGSDARPPASADGVDGEVDERLRREALRVYERYAVEVVEAFQLCPWARRARVEGRVRVEALVQAAPAVDAVLDHLDEMFGEARIEVGLVVLPRARWDRRRFRRFVESVRAGHASRHAAARAPGPPPLAMAAFHPAAPLELDTAARLVAFLRRTPDPTIQVVRQSALAAVRGPGGTGAVYAPRALLDLGALPAAPVSMADRVAESNLATVRRVGAERVAAVLDDICADRDRAYAALGVHTRLPGEAGRSC